MKVIGLFLIFTLSSSIWAEKSDQLRLRGRVPASFSFDEVYNKKSKATNLSNIKTNSPKQKKSYTIQQSQEQGKQYLEIVAH